MTPAIRHWRRWSLRLALAMGVVGLLATHGMMLYGMASRSALPVAALASGMAIMAVLKHLGLFGALLAALRRRFF